MSASALPPCPHCRREALLRPARYGDWREDDRGFESRDVLAYQVLCPACRMAGPEAETVGEAVAAWEMLRMIPPDLPEFSLAAVGERPASSGQFLLERLKAFVMEGDGHGR